MAAVSEMMQRERCATCRHFIRPNQCQEMRPQDRVSAQGWCKEYEHGTPDGAKHFEGHTPEELGYHE